MKIFISCLLLFAFALTSAQPITGVWRGKIVNGSGMRAVSCKVELKLIETTDSLVGTAYYYSNIGTFTRYAIKGFYSINQHKVLWEDDLLLMVQPEAKFGELGIFSESMIANANVNAAGKNMITLDGNSQIGQDGPKFTLHFEKADKPLFKDEWDSIIEKYTESIADTLITDSVYAIAKPYLPAQRGDVASSKSKKSAKSKQPVAMPAIATDVVQTAVVATALTEVIAEPAIEKVIAKETPPEVKPVPEKPVEKPVIKEEIVPIPPPLPKADTVVAVAAVKKEVEPIVVKDSVATVPVVEATAIQKLPQAKPDSVVAVAAVKKEDLPVVVNDTLRTVPVVETIAINKLAEPKPDFIAIAKKEEVKPAVTVVEKPVTIAEIPKAAIAKVEVPPAVKSSLKDSVKQAVVAAPEPKPKQVVAETVVKKPDPQPVAATVAKQAPAAQQPVVQKPVAQPPVNAEKKPATNTIAKQIPPSAASQTAVAKPTPVVAVVAAPPKPAPVVAKIDPPKPVPVVVKPDPIAEQMYITRQKIEQGAIPIAGDSIELNFYDNAEVDGDSIALFLNGKLLFNHVLLSTQPHTFKISTAELKDGSELTMVAENLGTIPPNTALMLAYIEGQRYSYRIESTDKTSGVVKLVRKK